MWILKQQKNLFLKDFLWTWKIHCVHKHSFNVSLCNKSRVQQRKTKVMWTDNILMGGIKDCKWSMEAATKWCPGDSFDVGILRGTPRTMPSLRGMQNGRHFPVPLSCSLTLCHSTASISCSPRSRFDSWVQTLVCVSLSLSLYIPPPQCHISPYPYLHNFLPLPLTLINSNNTPFPTSQPITPPYPLPPSLSVSLSLPPSVSFHTTKTLCDVQPWQVAPDLLSQS